MILNHLRATSFIVEIIAEKYIVIVESQGFGTFLSHVD